MATPAETLHCTVLGSAEFTVLAVGHPRNCQVLAELVRLAAGDNKSALGMLALLQERVPRTGIDQLASGKWKLLRDKIGEFRQSRGRGRQIRVLAFRAGRSVVVCSSAFEKERRIPDREIDNAIAQREQYLAAVRAGRVQWHTIPEQSE
jgi:hypothetical protein